MIRDSIRKRITARIFEIGFENESLPDSKFDSKNFEYRIGKIFDDLVKKSIKIGKERHGFGKKSM